LKKLLDRKSARLASVALANKMARIAWSVLTRGEVAPVWWTVQGLADCRSVCISCS
jgi:hypothetical protein